MILRWKICKDILCVKQLSIKWRRIHVLLLCVIQVSVKKLRQICLFYVMQLLKQWDRYFFSLYHKRNTVTSIVFHTELDEIKLNNISCIYSLILNNLWVEIFSGYYWSKFLAVIDYIKTNKTNSLWNWSSIWYLLLHHLISWRKVNTCISESVNYTETMEVYTNECFFLYKYMYRCVKPWFIITICSVRFWHCKVWQ